MQLEEGRKDPGQSRLNQSKAEPQSHRATERTGKKEREIDLYGFLSVALWLI